MNFIGRICMRMGFVCVYVWKMREKVAGSVGKNRKENTKYIKAKHSELTRIQQCAHFASELLKSFSYKRARAVLAIAAAAAIIAMNFSLASS
jgi:hypothetical protein